MVALPNDQPDFDSDGLDEKAFAELNRQISAALMAVGISTETSPEEVYLCALMQTHRVLNGLTKRDAHPERDDAKRIHLRKTLAALLSGFAADFRETGE